MRLDNSAPVFLSRYVLLTIFLRAGQDEHWRANDEPRGSAFYELMRQAMSDRINDHDSDEDSHDD